VLRKAGDAENGRQDDVKAQEHRQWLVQYGY
jgi:hypothetical protein